MSKTVQFTKGSFSDYEGKQHNFVIAAVVEKKLENSIVIQSDNNGDMATVPVITRIGLGVAICHPNDEFNQEYGEQVAQGRAEKYIDDSAYFTTNAFSILASPAVVKMILDNNAEHVINHPGFYIPGYDEAKAKYEAKLQDQADYDCLSEDERKVVNVLRAKNLSESGMRLVKQALKKY